MYAVPVFEGGRVFSSSEVAAAAGVSYRQLDHWTALGWVAPAGPPNPGAGGSRRWTLPETVRVAAIAELRHAGVGVAQAVALLDGHARPSAFVTVAVDESRLAEHVEARLRRVRRVSARFGRRHSGVTRTRVTGV